MPHEFGLPHLSPRQDAHSFPYVARKNRYAAPLGANGINRLQVRIMSSAFGFGEPMDPVISSRRRYARQE